MSPKPSLIVGSSSRMGGICYPNTQFLPCEREGVSHYSQERKGDMTAMTWPTLQTDPFIEDLLARNVPIAFGLSGGIDGATACAYTLDVLKKRGYTGKCIAIHSHLGRIEHTDSLPICQRLCEQLALPLVVVQRQAGDMMDRWLQRWNDNLARYRELLCVKLILPWSTAAMRFCNAELKTAILCRELVQMFSHQTILSVIGIRWDESPNRAKTPLWSPQAKLENKTLGTTGFNWHPILPWNKDQCFAYHDAYDLPVHEAYTKWGGDEQGQLCLLYFSEAGGPHCGNQESRLSRNLPRTRLVRNNLDVQFPTRSMAG